MVLPKTAPLTLIVSLLHAAASVARYHLAGERRTVGNILERNLFIELGIYSLMKSKPAL